MTCIYRSIVIVFFSHSKHHGGFGAELKRSQCHGSVDLAKPYSACSLQCAGTSQELPRMAHGSLSPAIRLLCFGPRGPLRRGTAWIMPANVLDPYKFRDRGIVNLAGLTDSM